MMKGGRGDEGGEGTSGEDTGEAWNGPKKIGGRAPASKKKPPSEGPWEGGRRERRTRPFQVRRSGTGDTT